MRRLTMSSVGEVIKRLRLKKGWTVKRLAEALGKSPAYVSMVENSKRDVRMATLEAFAKALGVPPAYLLSGRSEEEGGRMESLVDEILAVVERHLPEAKGALKRVKRVPVISYTAAGDPVAYEDMYPTGWAEEFIEGVVDIDDPNAFALRIRGDSMEPLLMDGDIVIVCPNWSLREGKPVVAKIRGGEITCKIYNRRERNIVLSAVNPRYQPVVVGTDEIEWLYPVVRVVRNIY